MTGSVRDARSTTVAASPLGEDGPPPRWGLLRGPLASVGAAVLLVATTAGSAANFLFHVVVSRQLLPADYGALGALLGVVLVMAVPAAAAQLAITRRVAQERHAGRPIVGPLLGEAVLWGVGGTLLLVAAAPVLSSFLHLGSAVPTLLLATYAIPVAVGIVPKAVLIGEERFGRFAFALVAGALVRLAAGPLLIAGGAGINGAVAASVFGELATAVLMLVAVGSVSHDDFALRDPIAITRRDLGASAIALTAFWVMTGVDTFLARHYLPSVDAGLYAAAATAGRIALFLPGAIAIVAFPAFASADWRRARAALVQSVGVVGLMGLATVGVSVVAPGLVVRVLFGGAYEGSAALLAALSLSSAALGLGGLLIHYHLAGARAAAANLVWIGIAVAAVGIVVWHDTPMQIAAVTALAASGTVLAMLAVALFGPAHDVSAPSRVGPLWDLPEPDLDLSVVVPYYNPGPALGDNVRRVVDVLASSGRSFEVIAVSDGSTDGSDAGLTAIDPRVRLDALLRNAGKGAALRLGLSAGRGRHLGFIDADGDIDPSHLHELIRLIELYDPDIVLGSKRHPDSVVDYPPIRRLYSWGYQQLVRVLFRLNVRDTQTGLKVIKREVLADVLPRMLEKRYAFDLELLVVARACGHIGFTEAPVSIEHHFTSTISWRAARNTFLDTLAVWYRLKLLRWYS